MADPKDVGHELAWDGEIEHDGSGFVLLEKGEYPFRVVKLERKRFEGSAKLPACNSAALTIEVGDADTATTLIHNLYLHQRTEGLLCAFFRAIGQRQHGEKFRMDWGKVVGATGRCKVGVRDWKGKDGETRQSNQIEHFLDPEAAAPKVTANPVEAGADDIPF